MQDLQVVGHHATILEQFQKEVATNSGKPRRRATTHRRDPWLEVWEEWAALEERRTMHAAIDSRTLV
jgi:uncharacterized phage-associated protein